MLCRNNGLEFLIPVSSFRNLEFLFLFQEFLQDLVAKVDADFAGLYG
jgi:hypothetical protein